MTHAFQSLARHFAYLRTRSTLRALPLRTRMDCNLDGREDELAHRAVYGA